jgi:hypothetical protein
MVRSWNLGDLDLNCLNKGLMRGFVGIKRLLRKNFLREIKIFWNK